MTSAAAEGEQQQSSSTRMMSVNFGLHSEKRTHSKMDDVYVPLATTGILQQQPSRLLYSPPPSDPVGWITHRLENITKR